MQFSLISLIPGLIRNLQDCADPELDSYVQNLEKPTSLRTSERNSLLNYMGLPLQIFGKVRDVMFETGSADILQGSLFGPYTPLQQLDLLADYGTKSYIVGSTNSLLLQQKDRYSDILINLDEDTINISSTSLRSALSLSAADRRWIDFITQAVNETWDESNPGRPKTMGYLGSEEFIRLQFEEYLLSLISAVKCHNYIVDNAQNPKAMLPHIESDPAFDFGMDWIDAWSRSENYRIWEKYTDSHLFDIVEPKHPCAGGLTIDDVQRRIAEQVKEFHLDERFAVGREVIGRNLQAGREKASTVFSKLYADMEALRESQRRKNEEHKREAEANGQQPASPAYDHNGSRQTVSSKAGAYIGSWSSWVGEKRKTGWGRTASGAAKRDSAPTTPVRLSAEPTPVTSIDNARPSTRESYKENIFDAEAAPQSKRASHQPTVVEAQHVESNHAAAPSKFHEILDESPTITQAPAAVPAPHPTPAVVAAVAAAPTPAPTAAVAVAAVPAPEPTPVAAAPISAAAAPEATPAAFMAAKTSTPDDPTTDAETGSKPEDVVAAVAEAVQAASTSSTSPW